MKNNDAIMERANYLGYDIRDISHLPPYNQRKGKTFGLFDRRSNSIVCSYSSIARIGEYLAEGR